MNETDHHVQEEDLVKVARHVLDALGVSPLAELAITLVDVEHMTELHVKWMGEPGPTDVLSFPMDELDLRGSRGAGHAHEEKPDDTLPMMLGDVVLCPVVAEKQAKDAGHSIEDELHLLTTHGILHLVGFDHAEPEEHAEMFGLQGELLASWKASRGS
ncbi:MAG: putative rRNA maturation factor [Frankiales bacterium]|jgi:probable rRNA maturation factor|nr:putative rRNA maturation factor [Frankiales bacterium]